MVTPFDVFFWRGLFVAALLVALTIGVGISWLVARIRARDRLPQGRSMPGAGARTQSTI